MHTVNNAIGDMVDALSGTYYESVLKQAIPSNLKINVIALGVPYPTN
jgi:hypothetical protein